MKFSHTFHEALKQEDYPAHWIKSAISYRQLKKCIKDVQKELSSIGLEPETLRSLWNSLGTPDSSQTPLKYTFAGLFYRFSLCSIRTHASTGDRAQFTPKLIFTISDDGDTPVDASLAPETRAFLKDLVEQKRLSASDPDSTTLRNSTQYHEVVESQDQVTNGVQAATVTSETVPVSKASPTVVEIPLTADSTFFRLLTLDMSSLNALRSEEIGNLNGTIVGLGQGVSRVADPSRQREKNDLYTWREIFKLYTESDVFFSTNERNRSANDSAKSQKQLEYFLEKLRDLNIPKKLKKSESRSLLNQFIGINMALLKHVKFQELNTLAMMKILKS
jgi:E3 ubiquitin-protein ligase BAH